MAKDPKKEVQDLLSQLEKGYSKQFIALRLMKQKHCDDIFLKNCLKYLSH